MRLQGRIALCGMIVQYNDADHPHGLRNAWQLVVNRVGMPNFASMAAARFEPVPNEAARMAQACFGGDRISTNSIS